MNLNENVCVLRKWLIALGWVLVLLGVITIISNWIVSIFYLAGAVYTFSASKLIKQSLSNSEKTFLKESFKKLASACKLYAWINAITFIILATTIYSAFNMIIKGGE